ncbi:DNA-binding transcriptional regulator, ArsR family [Marinospirillum celere]|uniref:DNA-binding transcriptional regulator, ArsR family n=1 Tax=Marinospirillum celere TaxID=1122252 RepID=A0A1I1EDX2_9GAMM|nr:metalloregulator ArsR/SmtB family transcription factor [Marinospirillum celere]SFB84976.1 DNA-binding transcriptional regulator, ArsR family [Marinospirillum celere]
MANALAADEQLISELRNNAQQATTLLKALANENRLMILCYLEGKEMSVTELNDCLDLSQSALSQHLAILRRDGLVKTRRESQTIFYSLKGEEAKQVISTLHSIYCA